MKKKKLPTHDCHQLGSQDRKINIQTKKRIIIIIINVVLVFEKLTDCVVVF